MVHDPEVQALVLMPNLHTDGDPLVKQWIPSGMPGAEFFAIASRATARRKRGLYKGCGLHWFDARSV